MDNLTIRFLANAASLLKKAKSSENIDGVINQLRFKSLEFSSCAPNELNSSEVCKHCGNVWQDGLFSLKVKCHKNNKIRKRIRKLDLIAKLSPCRRDFLSYYKTQKDNILIKKCLVCKSITKCSMSKPYIKTNTKEVDLQCVKNESSTGTKRKRKSGKKQSFAGLSPAAVLQARLSSCQTNVESINLHGSDVSKICEPIHVNNLSVKKNLLLSNSAQKPDKFIPSSTIPRTIPNNDLSFKGIYQENVKKQKLNDPTTITTNKSSKKKKKSFLSEVQSFL